uniref:Uncharacterized protein n=1 Tax=Plectus sambesii TaxID=2011161 RepID=A0A914ULG2_9BILA
MRTTATPTTVGGAASRSTSGRSTSDAGDALNALPDEAWPISVDHRAQSLPGHSDHCAGRIIADSHPHPPQPIIAHSHCSQQHTIDDPARLFRRCV